MKALTLTVWDEKIFKNFLLYLYVKSETPQHRANFRARAITWTVLVEGHLMMLHVKYYSSSPYGLGQEDFKGFFFVVCHGNKGSSWNSNLWSILKVHNPSIISAKFHWNPLIGFRGEDFLVIIHGRTDRLTNGRRTLTEYNSSSRGLCDQVSHKREVMRLDKF